MESLKARPVGQDDDDNGIAPRKTKKGSGDIASFDFETYLQIITTQPISTRGLNDKDVELGAEKIEPWIVANLGDDGATQYKNARLAHAQTWVIPASLLMTVSFGFMFMVTREEIAATPDGIPYEGIVRSVVGHLYVLCMALSAVQALRCVNHYSQYQLGLNNTPAKLVPFYEIIKRDAYKAQFNEKSLMPFWITSVKESLAEAPPPYHSPPPAWTRLLPPTSSWQETVDTFIRWRSWSVRLFAALKLPRANHAFFSAIDFLNAGVALGAYLKLGIGYAAICGGLFFVCAQEMRQMKNTLCTVPIDLLWRSLPRVPSSQEP